MFAATSISEKINEAFDLKERVNLTYENRAEAYKQCEWGGGCKERECAYYSLRITGDKQRFMYILCETHSEHVMSEVRAFNTFLLDSEYGMDEALTF